MTSPAQPAALRAKIGQMILVGFRGCTPGECDLVVRDIREQGVGGIILFDQEMADPTNLRRNIESSAQVKQLISHLQAQA